MERRDTLKLRARDAADMDVIASFLQDAIVPVKDVVWLPADKRFVMVLNRFMWERSDGEEVAMARDDVEQRLEDGGDASFADVETRATFFRTNAGLTFDKVKGIARKGFDLGQRERLLSLMTIETRSDCITLYFADSAAVRLDISDVACHLEDLGEPWPTWTKPDHESPDPQQALTGF